jgi:hypothetical protein
MCWLVQDPLSLFFLSPSEDRIDSRPGNSLSALPGDGV